MADAVDLGSTSHKEWRFESSHPHLHEFIQKNQLEQPLETIVNILKDIFKSPISLDLDADPDSGSQWVRVIVKVPDGVKWDGLYKDFVDRRIEATDPRTDWLIRVSIQ